MHVQCSACRPFPFPHFLLSNFRFLISAFLVLVPPVLPDPFSSSSRERGLGMRLDRVHWVFEHPLHPNYKACNIYSLIATHPAKQVNRIDDHHIVQHSCPVVVQYLMQGVWLTCLQCHVVKDAYHYLHCAKIPT